MVSDLIQQSSTYNLFIECPPVWSKILIGVHVQLRLHNESSLQFIVRHAMQAIPLRNDGM